MPKLRVALCNQPFLKRPRASLNYYLSLIITLLILFTTTCTDTPTTPTLTSTPAHTPTPNTPQSTLHIPHWLTYQYPTDWFPITSRAPGFAGVASRDIGILPSNNLARDTAVFYIFQGDYQSTDPLIALQEERLPRLSDEVEILSSPDSSPTIKGLPAAALGYRFTLNDGSPGIVRLTLVRTPDGRYAEIWAISREEDIDHYTPIFDQIESTLTLNDLHPAPPVPSHSDGRPPSPVAFIPYTAPDDTFTLSHPPDWETVEADFGLLLHPNESPSTAQLAIGPVPQPQPGANGPQLLETIATNLLPQLIFDAIRISPIAEDETHTHARAYYAGADEGQPVFILVATIQSGDTQLYAIGIMPSDSGETPDVLETVEAVLDSIMLDAD